MQSCNVLVRLGPESRAGYILGTCCHQEEIDREKGGRTSLVGIENERLRWLIYGNDILKTDRYNQKGCSVVGQPVCQSDSLSMPISLLAVSTTAYAYFPQDATRFKKRRKEKCMNNGSECFALQRALCVC